MTGTTTDPLSYSEQGTYTVTWTFDDGKGNTSTQTQQVIVDDVTPPNVQTQNITIELDDSGNASITPEDIDNGSTDNCGIASMTVSSFEFTCDDLGENPVTLTVTDNNGNVADDTATVTVLPYTIPVSTTGVITDRPTSSYRDVAMFKMTGVTDIGTVAMDAAAAGTALTFEFRTADKGRLYSFTADSF
ncbi:MAG: hypothetical protein D3904_16585, partial [Candidatus Electrothrix sp. EH2]|nr:hypothetical protein [Candidatus Electrothrix sp. EH2]